MFDNLPHACLEATIVIELDDSQHQQRHSYDERRDRCIEAEGFRIIRFWDNQVFQVISAVRELILGAVKTPPS